MAIVPSRIMHASYLVERAMEGLEADPIASPNGLYLPHDGSVLSGRSAGSSLFVTMSKPSFLHLSQPPWVHAFSFSQDYCVEK